MLHNPPQTVVVSFATVEVFNGASPNPIAWTDLDLNASVGPNALALVKVYNAAGSARWFGFRRKGETEAPDMSAPGMTSCQLSGTKFGICIAPTDINGITQWEYTLVDQANITIDVIGKLPG